MGFEIEQKDRSYASVSNVLRSCLGVLNNRDHSIADLRAKQLKKGYDAEMIEEAINKLVEDGYVDDERFAKGFFNSRLNRGHGPSRIRIDMRKKLIPENLITEILLNECDEVWKERAVALKVSKFGLEIKSDQKWKAKVWRFLSYRGYSSSHISEALNPHSEYLEGHQ